MKFYKTLFVLFLTFIFAFSGSAVTPAEKRAELEALLNKSVAAQEYEKAAEYRDMIKELDASTDDSNTKEA